MWDNSMHCGLQAQQHKLKSPTQMSRVIICNIKLSLCLEGHDFYPLEDFQLTSFR
jgi:hypothetical protein